MVTPNKLSLLQTILTDGPTEEIDRLYPFYPLTYTGMPLPGPSFCRQAVTMGGAPVIAGKGKSTQLVDAGKYLHYLYRRALYDRRFSIHVLHKNQLLQAQYITGHPLNAAGSPDQDDDETEMAFGPRPSDVMVVGKHPGREELQQYRNFCGPASEDLYKAFSELGLTEKDYGDWYFTNAMRFGHLDPNSASIPIDWMKDCAPLLHQELLLVRPKFVLCFGGEAIKAILGKSYTVTSAAGRVFTVKIDMAPAGQAPDLHVMRVMGMLHPSAVFHRPELYDEFVLQLGMFWQVVSGVDLGAAESDLDHKAIYTERELSRVIDEMLADPREDADIIAADAEWHGDYPTEPGAYLRTVQISNKAKWARAIVLRHAGGAPAFKPSIAAAFKQLNRLFHRNGRDLGNGKVLVARGATPLDAACASIDVSAASAGGSRVRNRNVTIDIPGPPPEPDLTNGIVTKKRPRVGGHFFRADLPWFLHNGLDLRKLYAPDKVDPREGGWDTSLMYHAVNEATRYKLEDVAMRLTTAPRYDDKLQEWKKTFCATNRLQSEQLDGYGECPAAILIPYGCYDADVTWRIQAKLREPGGMLDKDAYGNNCWPSYHLHHRASLCFLEMEQVGMVVDRNRVDELVREFMEAQQRLLAELRRDLNWPDYNPKSTYHAVAALFGDQYVSKRDKETGLRARIRPEGALTLGLMPLTTTGKRPKLWSRVLQTGEADFLTPSTNKEVLGILGHKNPIARKQRDFKFIAQVMQSTLRVPTANDEGVFDVDENGNYEYEKGIAGLMHADGRIRTHLAQILETARAASRRPNLQNLSKRREDDYKRIIGKNVHVHPVRSILMMPPGYVGIEADLVGAELAVLAWLSQDPNMIDHVRRSALPEADPDHYDIHSQQAVRAFNLTDVVPTKTGMKKAGVPGLRVAAKNVNFGIPYGRSAEAIARQCAEEGVDVTEHDCQLMIDAYFAQYPGTEVFLEECRTRSQGPKWLRGPYGSYRRFVSTNDRGVIGEQHRQSQNFPIQNGVADNVTIGLTALKDFRDTLNPDECWFEFVLQIHDAVILMCKVEHAHRVYHEILPECMVQRAPFWPMRLDGTPIQVDAPYRFGIDREVFIHWGEAITDEEAQRYQLPEWMLHH